MKEDIKKIKQIAKKAQVIKKEETKLVKGGFIITDEIDGV